MMGGEDNEPTQRPLFDKTNLLSSSEDFQDRYNYNKTNDTSYRTV